MRIPTLQSISPGDEASIRGYLEVYKQHSGRDLVPHLEEIADGWNETDPRNALRYRKMR
jgi:hypothetical protein